MTAYWWIRDDQRLYNHPTLKAALAWREETGATLRAVYVQGPTAPARFSEYPDPVPRSSPVKEAYLQASLEALTVGLKQLDVEIEITALSLEAWLTDRQPDAVFFTFGAAWEEREAERILGSSGVPTRGYHSRTLLHPQEAFQPDLPSTYTPFRKRVESLLGDVPFPGIQPFEGSANLIQPFSAKEAEARAHLYAYVAAEGPGRRYKTSRNGMLNTQDSTKLSAYLSLGLVHPQEVWNRCLEVENAVGGCEEIYWIRFELLWREYFQWVAYEAGAKLFQARGLKREASPETRMGSRKAFELWTEGRTGDALVDAAMRELKATGYQSNRARQNAASYWIHDLKQPWRVGAAYFEAMLVDYDAASNWGNWAYIAGVGNDPRPFRKFNTHKQAEQYDSDGSYRAAWSSQ